MFSSKVEDEMKPMKTVRFLPEEKQLPVKSPHLHGRSSAGNFARGGNGSVGSSKVFPEDHETWQKGILDPKSDIALKWNRIFLGACLVALFVDPFYFYLPRVDKVEGGSAASACTRLNLRFGKILVLFRTLADVFYVLQILVKFRTAYTAPSSRVFGRGELVMNRWKIAKRYLQKDFFIDLFAALPLPQIVFWIITAQVKRTSASGGQDNSALTLIVLIQYFPRLYLIFPLSSQIIKTTGNVTKTGWAGAAYNLFLYMLASHVVGALWYLLSIDRQSTCWKSECGLLTKLECKKGYFDCNYMDNREWLNGFNNTTMIFKNCNVSNESIEFKFGIFESALSKDILSAGSTEKYFYCLWWGLQQLSSYGQNLTTSTYLGETLFASLIAILGLVLFAHLIGNMQTYLQSLTLRLEEWRLKKSDTEEWMRHRQLPHDLRGRVHKYVQYKWFATRGVDEDAILRSLPTDLRRDIQRHLCLDLVRQVPFFSQMDEPLLDAICNRLTSSLNTKGTYIVCEGDPVMEMLFIIRGKLESSTTNGGRTGFFNSTILRPGDFCGEELLTWALHPKSAINLPTSTQTVRALVEVETFALRAEDVKFVANQFRRLHSKKFQHTFRFYSHQWRSWAACLIQLAWHRFKRRKMAKDRSTHASFASRYDEGEQDDSPSIVVSHISEKLPTQGNVSAAAISASKLSASFRRGSKKVEILRKPEEPDFSTDGF